MRNNIFKNFRPAAPAQTPDFRTISQSFMSDPLKALSSVFSVPGNVGNDPQSIANYLVQSGQVSQKEIDAAQQQFQQMFGKRL